MLSVKWNISKISYRLVLVNRFESSDEHPAMDISFHIAYIHPFEPPHLGSVVVIMTGETLGASLTSDSVAGIVMVLINMYIAE